MRYSLFRNDTFISDKNAKNGKFMFQALRQSY